ncbi:MAG: nucleotide pyrophosphohydrolase [Opitutaceae bacterium]|nr:nucleotide pyrophosphohydrolase [Opitutaceae bacterium]
MSAIDALCETVSALRAPGGCAWDIEQTHQSLAVCLIDECCELLETLDTLDMDHMREELGDVLIQVLMHAQIASENGIFDFDTVCKEVNDKLIRRHPHVFGPDDLNLKDSTSVLKKWDEIKAGEKNNRNQKEGKLFKNLPPMLPALLRARDVYKQIQKQDLDVGTEIDQVNIKSTSEELTEAAVGKALFEIAAACRVAGIDPESALRRYSNQIVDSIEDSHRD